MPVPKVTSVLTLNEMSVTGIFRTPRGYAAMVEATPIKLSYTIYPGEKFFDGQLVAVEENRLVFRKVTKMGNGKLCRLSRTSRCENTRPRMIVQGTAPAGADTSASSSGGGFVQPKDADGKPKKEVPIVSPLDEINKTVPESASQKKSDKKASRSLSRSLKTNNPQNFLRHGYHRAAAPPKGKAKTSNLNMARLERKTTRVWIMQRRKHEFSSIHQRLCSTGDHRLRTDRYFRDRHSGQRVGVDQQGRHYGDPGFPGEPINLNVVNADIRDILNYITEQYGINFVIDKSVKAVPVTVKVSEVPWNIALDSILHSQGLGVQVNGNILRVADIKTARDRRRPFPSAAENQLDSSPLLTEMIRLNYARAQGRPRRGVATAGTTTETVGGISSNPYSDTRQSGPTFEQSGSGSSTDGLLPIIKRRLSKRGAIEVDGRSNSLIITDVRENIDAIKQLVAILDQPEPQVEIEARIVVATRNFSRDIGVQLSGIVIGPRGSGARAARCREHGTSLPIPPSLPTTTANNSLFSSIPNTVIGLTTGIFGTAQISALISAGEQKGQAKIIATPRVTALNGQKAKIKSGTKMPITTIQPGAAAGGAVVATTQYVDVPLKLEITPQITDVGTVVLDVLAENARQRPSLPEQLRRSTLSRWKHRLPCRTAARPLSAASCSTTNARTRTARRASRAFRSLATSSSEKVFRRNTNEILFFITPRIMRADYGDQTGTSGVRKSSTIVQPVPLGNPSSNSDNNVPNNSGSNVPVLPLAQPAVVPSSPNKP